MTAKKKFLTLTEFGNLLAISNHELKTAIIEGIAKEIRSLESRIGDRFDSQSSSIENKLRELKEEMYSEFDKVHKHLNDIDEEIIFLDTKREDLENTLRIKKPQFVVN